MSRIPDAIGQGIAQPFYIFLTLLLGVIATATAQALWASGGLLILVMGLYCAHAGLYWLNFALKNKKKLWWPAYYRAQTALKLGI